MSECLLLREVASAGYFLIKVHLLLVYSLKKLIELCRVILIVEHLRWTPLTPCSRIEVGTLVIFRSRVDRVVCEIKITVLHLLLCIALGTE